MDPDRDPGWRSALKDAVLSLIPGWGLRYRMRRTRGADGLTTLRAVFLSFVLGIALVGVVVAVLEANGGRLGTTPETPMAVVVLAVGAAGLVAANLVRRPLACDSEAALAKSYRQRFFLHAAAAEAPALVGFVGFITTSAGWLYLLGAAFAAVGFAKAAPTANHLARIDDELRQTGCALTIGAALRAGS